MVTLRSEGKPAATAVVPSPSHTRKATSLNSNKTARRSLTPDRASQDSALRRSQRVKDRQGVLESIQEDTAASAEAQAVRNVSVTAAQPELAQIPEESAAVQPVPEISRAQAVQNAILQASDTSEGNHPSCSHISAAESSADDTDDDESNDDILAQLSENMWAALRPGTQAMRTDTAQQSSLQQDAAHSDGMQGVQPHNLQAGRQTAHADDEEAELQWQPVTGLPEPLTARRCSKLQTAPGYSELEKQFMLQPRDTRGITKQANKLAPQTAGKQWFDLPAQQLTDETRRDLKLLQLRGTFDPKRFYKSSDHKKGLPKFFQIGKVVEASADFYSGRLSSKERKRTITEELLADPDLSQARKRRFDKLQDEKTYWASKRGRKTDLPRGKQTTRSKKR